MHSAHQGRDGFGISKRRGGIGLLVLWLMLLLAVPAIASSSHDDDDHDQHYEHSLFGPKKYTRAQGKPSSWTSTFTACPSAASATLKLTNGSGSKSRVSSAVVTLNGVKVIAEKDLNRNVPSLARTINLKGGINTITVTIKSGAGDDDDHHDGDDGNEHHDGDDEHSGDDGNDPAAVFLILQITGAACGSSDTAPPLISTPQPADGALLAIARPAISVAFIDNSGGSGIDTASVRVTLDGSDITTACSITATGAVCTPAGNLNDGMHSVTVALADLSKNQAGYAWRFTIDTTPPQVAVTSPQNSQNLGSPLVIVTGTTDDASANITVNGIPATLSGLTFSAADVPLTEGANSITIIARDPLGNQSTTTLNVTLDTSLPVVTITAPLDGSFTNVPTVTVSGQVSEAPESVTVNGYAATISSTSTFTSILPLAEGQNTITALAQDLAGNKGSAVTNVTLDTVNPQIFVTVPVNGLLTRNPQLNVSGTISETVASLSINGQAVTVAGQTFSTPLTLVEGANTITLEATDRAGNKGNASIAVTFDSTPPIVPVLETLTSPTNNPIVTVKGSAEPGSSVALSAGGVQIANSTADSAGLFSFSTITLTEGDNPFTAQATDTAGNVSPLSAPLTLVLDTKAPVITVTAPAESAFLSAAQVSVKGSIDETLASLTINGASTPLSDLTFDQQITLTPGLNSIVLVATDLADNSSTKTVLVTLDSTPPVVTITAPLSGRVTNNAQVTVTGTISKANSTATINGTAITVANQTFNFVYTLNEGDNSLVVEATDRAGNKGSASVNATLDTQLPLLSLQAPAEAAGGANVAITFTASDNKQLTLVELKADGVPIWSGGNAPSLIEAVSYRLSPTLNAGAVVTLQIKGTDAAGNEGTATASILITQAAMGPGYIQGKVLEDSRGLKLQGAEVVITPQLTNTSKSITTPTDGGYFQETPAGTTLVKITKPGFTSVERLVSVIPEKNITVLDARLTAINNQKNLVDAAGGVVKVDIVLPSAFSLTVPSNALPAETDIRLTPVSNQGLAGLLPLGWSPLAALDIRLLDPVAGTILATPFASPATVKLPLPAAFVSAPITPLLLARYDETTHTWLAIEATTIDSGSATAHLNGTGQYALVVADPAPNAPPVAVAGQELKSSALSLQPDFSLTTTTGKVVPQAAPPSTGLKAAGEVIVTAKDGATPTFTSGLVLNSRITEKFDLKLGDKIEPPVYSQDIILYRLPCITNIGAGALSAVSVAELRTTFPVSPSKDYSIVDLLLGKVGLEIVVPETTENGVMVGTDGGRLVDADGNILAIPQGALGLTTPVATKTAAAATGVVGTDFTFIKAVEVNLTRQTLAVSATLSIPTPDGFNPSLQLIVAKQIDVKGVAKLKLVALARQSGSFINSDTTQAGISLPGITTSGTYYFLQAKAPLGFVTGTVTDSGNAPFNGALVKTDTGSLVDLSASNGKYLVAAPVAAVTVTATDLYKNDEGYATGSITTANQAVTIDLKILMIPPTVVSVSPNGVNVQPTLPVVVTFSKSMDNNSINSTTLKLIDSTGTPIPGVFTFSVDGKTVTLTSAELLKSEKSYTVTIGGDIKDLQGYTLGSDVTSGFTVRKTTAPPMPAAGSISGTFPDADGYITVTGTQGSAEAGNTVLLINDTTGEIQAVTPASDGSFTGKIRGQLGDEIKVVLMDYSGNQTTISYLTFKSPDGSYLVTAKGGKVEGEGGSLLEIPDGALVGATVIKVTPVQQAGLPSPIQTPGTFLSAFNIDTGGLNFQKEVHLSIPVPSGFDPKTPVFVVKPGEVYNEDGTVEKVYEIIDSTKVINGRITTASPPFDGIMALGSYIFTAFPEVQLGIASGYAYQEMNALPGYQEAPSRAAWDELLPGTNPVDKMYKYDRPVQGAVIRTPAAMNYVSYSRSSGFYAGFSTLFGNVGAADLEYKLTATHPQTMRRESLTGYLSADGTSSRNIEKLNFKLADKDTIIPDKTAPAIDFGLQLAPGQGASAKLVSGTVTLGSDVQVALSVIDQLMDKVYLTVEYKTAEMPTAVQAAVPLELTGKVLYAPAGPGSPAISRYSYTPTFAGELKGSVVTNFRPQQVGIYTLTVQATDMAGNTSNRKIELRAVVQGEIPAAVDGPPFVLTVSPGDKSADIRIDTSVQAVFSELVTNVNETTFRLFDKATSQPISAEVSLAVDGGLVRAILIPRANLVYGREYLVRISTAITDASANLSADGALLPLYREITTTFTTTIPKAYDLTANPFSGGRDVALYTDLDNNRLYSYVTAGDQGWRAVDVSNADKPEVLWPRPDLGIPSADYKFPAGFFYRGVAVEQQEKLLGMTENITFADGNQYGYLRLYDLSDPKKPVVAGRELLSEAYTGIPGRLAMRGKYAYISTVGAGLQIVNTKTAIDRQSAGGATDGSAIVGGYDTLAEFGHPNDIALSGANGVVLTTNSGYLLTFDVTTPEIPMVQGSSRPDGTWYQRVAMADDYVFTSAEGTTGVMNLAVVGGRKSVGSAQEGRVFTLDLSDPANPRQLAPVKDKDGVEVNVSVMDVSINKAAGMAFVAGFVTSGGSTVNAIQIIDIRDPYHPLLMSTITQLPDMNAVVPPGGTRPMIPIGSTMALTDLNGWLYLANQPKGVRTLQLVDGPSLASRCDDCYNQIK